MANILVVDDDTAIMTMISRILSKDGHNVTSMSDPVAVSEMRMDNFGLSEYFK